MMMNCKNCLFVLAVVFACISSSRANIISYIRFEEGSGFGAFDETGLMNGEVLNFSDVSPGGGDTGPQGWSVDVSSPTVPLTGAANTGSMRFAGGSAFIDLSTVNALSPGTEFTIELFMKPDQPVIGSPIYFFSPSSEMGFALTESLGALYFNSGFEGYNPPPVAADAVQIGEWQHLAVVKEIGQYSIYLNGTPITTEPLPASTDGPYLFPGTGTTGDRTFGDGFRGYLDEFRISDEALSPSQFLNVPEPSTWALMLTASLLFGIKPLGRKLRSLRSLRVDSNHV